MDRPRGPDGRFVKVTVQAEVDQYKRRLNEAATSTDRFGASVDRSGKSVDGLEKKSKSAGKEIDKLSGRLRLATDALLIFGPALGSLGAAGVAGIVAMSAQLGAMAGALGVTLLAVNGLGDGLKALDAYQLEPTAENLEKLNQEFAKLGPSGEHFVRFLDSLEPELQSLQMAARDGLFPDAEEGIEKLLDRLPELRELVSGMAQTMGDLASDAGGALGGQRFDAFFEYLRTDGIPILDETSRTLGYLAEAAASTFVAFAPLSRDFSGGLLEFAEGLAEASANLESNAGFQEFLAYIEQTGPQVLDTLGALANAVLQIVEATAPLGGPVLVALEGVANAIALIADSDLGTPIFGALAALALYNRAVALTGSLNQTAWGGKAIAGMKSYTTGLYAVTTAQERAQMTATQLDAANRTNWAGMAKGAGQVGLLAFSMSGLADSTGLSNTAMLSVAGPWGTVAGVALDLMHATDGLKSSITAMNAAMDSTDTTQITAALEQVNAELEKAQANTILGSSFFGDTIGGIVNTVAPLSNSTKAMGLWTGTTKEASEAQAELEDHLANVGGAADGATRPVYSFADAMSGASDSAAEEAARLEDATQAMRDHRSEALRALNAQINYEAALDDASQAIKDNGKNFDIATEKGRANRQALYGIADAWNQQSDAAKNAKGSLASARDNFIQTATQMGATAEQAKKLADRLFEIPPSRVTKIALEAGGVNAELDAILGRMRQLRDRTVHVNVVTNNVRPQGGQAPTEDNVTTTPRRTPRRTPRTTPRISGRGALDINAGDIYTSRGLSGTKGGLYARETTTPEAEDVKEDTKAVHKGARDFVVALGALKAALKKSEKALDRERDARDKALDNYNSYVSSVGGAYSSLDPFAAASGSVWGSGGGALASFDNALAGNIANTQAAQSALSTAAGNGLNGPLYDALAGSGNLQLLQAFAGLSADQIELREQQFAAQSAAQTSLGTMAAAQAGLQTALDGANARLDKVVDQVRELRQDVKQASKDNKDAQDKNAKDVGMWVNGAAANGHRRGR